MFNHILDYYAHQMRHCPWSDVANYSLLSRAYFNTSLVQVRGCYVEPKKSYIRKGNAK